MVTRFANTGIRSCAAPPRIRQPCCTRSTRAQVPATIFSVSLNRLQRVFITTLKSDTRSWLDGYAIREHGHPFLRCAPADQTAMLHSLDQGAGPGHNFFRFVKSVTARIYYNTQIGYQELNKGG